MYWPVLQAECSAVPVELLRQPFTQLETLQVCGERLRRTFKRAPAIAADPGGFPEFLICFFLNMSIFRISLWDLGSGRACNGLEMAVGFKWTDSQLISTHMGPFSTFSSISIILLSFPMV